MTRDRANSFAAATSSPATPVVDSVNVGGVREVEWGGEIIRTGIWKYSVGDRRVALRDVNLDGDDQADRTVHGGADKAVYAYAMEDYDYWRDNEDVNAEPGLFGENLTLRNVDLSAALVGERWAVGTAVLEVAQPRLPCYKLGIRMSDVYFPKRFMSVARLGAYLRIIVEGDVGAGDTIELVSRPGHDVSLSTMARALRDSEAALALRAARQLPPFWRRVAAGE